MFLRLTINDGGGNQDNPIIVNSDEIATVMPFNDSAWIAYRSNENVTLHVKESFEQIATLLHAVMPESVGTKPAIHNVLINACLANQRGYRTSTFDASLIQHATESEDGSTIFQYGELMYRSNESFANLMYKIQSVLGK